MVQYCHNGTVLSQQYSTAAMVQYCRDMKINWYLQLVVITRRRRTVHTDVVTWSWSRDGDWQRVIAPNNTTYIDNSDDDVSLSSHRLAMITQFTHQLL